MMNDYITIPEFAKRAGISHQAVYKQLRNQLQPYLQLVAGKKMLSVQALLDVYGIEVAQPDATSATDSATSATESATNSDLIQALQAQNEYLRNQVEQKDRQIESLLRIQEQGNALALADKGIKFLGEGEGPREGSSPPSHTKSKRWFQFWRKDEE